MNPIWTIAVFLLGGMSAAAADRDFRTPEQISIATTGRIVRIDLKNKIFKVRGSDNQAIRSLASTPEMKQSLRQRFAVTLPGGISLGLPGRMPKPSAKPAGDSANNLEEYTVVFSNTTVFQDGGDAIRVEDFKVGETISIHGVLHGNTLTASRIAKWF